jgi:transcriptional regulator with PAS, ATPase and Fis domain
MNTLNNADWINEFNAAITVCDKDGIIVAMNDKSVKTFEKDGGINLIGTNLYECHTEPSKSKLKMLMDNHISNCYTIEKSGKKKLIYQSPWLEEGEFKGYVEISIELPETLRHFIRD